MPNFRFLLSQCFLRFCLFPNYTFLTDVRFGGVHVPRASLVLWFYRFYRFVSYATMRYRLPLYWTPLFWHVPLASCWSLTSLEEKTPFTCHIFRNTCSLFAFVLPRTNCSILLLFCLLSALSLPFTQLCLCDGCVLLLSHISLLPYRLFIPISSGNETVPWVQGVCCKLWGYGFFTIKSDQTNTSWTLDATLDAAANKSLTPFHTVQNHNIWFYTAATVTLTIYDLSF